MQIIVSSRSQDSPWEREKGIDILSSRKAFVSHYLHRRVRWGLLAIFGSLFLHGMVIGVVGEIRPPEIPLVFFAEGLAAVEVVDLPSAASEARASQSVPPSSLDQPVPEKSWDRISCPKPLLVIPQEEVFFAASVPQLTNGSERFWVQHEAHLQRGEKRTLSPPSLAPPSPHTPPPIPLPQTEVTLPSSSSPGAEGDLRPQGVTTAFHAAVRPVYPRESRRRGEEGTVLLEVEVRPDGRVGMIKILQSSGYPRLDQAAVEALRKAQYVQKSGDGKGGRLILACIFRLENK